LGRVDYSLEDTRKPIRFQGTQERDGIEKRLERLNTRSAQIKSVMAKSGRQDELKIKELRFLETKQKELEKALRAFGDKNFYRHIDIPVQHSLKDDPKIIKEVEAYRAESSKLYQPES